ncbi:MAG: YkgJ family cysteine cluster protein [Planctomycetota bacterium]|nr:YkgJ family cysteine cluster protein [Planctomycetota bacterium]
MDGPPPQSAPERWYEPGLAFDCTACGRCCRDHGEYSYVYVSDKDLQGLSKHLGMTEEAFLEAYCREEDGWTILKRNGDACVLLEPSGLCGAYEARPKQCATWPWWVDNLASPKVWEVDVKGCCPGIGKGEVVPADEIDRIAEETEVWYEGE